jgi:hypothetical protein
MLGSLGGFVDHLHRLAVGPLVLPLDSTPGSIREVTPAELAALEALLPADRSGSVAVSLCTIVHALYTRFTKRFSTSISDPTDRSAGSRAEEQRDASAKRGGGNSMGGRVIQMPLSTF